MGKDSALTQNDQCPIKMKIAKQGQCDGISQNVSNACALVLGLQESEPHVSHSLDVAEESHSTLSSTGEIRSQEELLGPVEVIQHGGEDGLCSRGGSQRQGLPANRSDSSVVRRGRGTNLATKIAAKSFI